jgi:hypothetical protein
MPVLHNWRVWRDADVLFIYPDGSWEVSPKGEVPRPYILRSFEAVYIRIDGQVCKDMTKTFDINVAEVLEAVERRARDIAVLDALMALPGEESDGKPHDDRRRDCTQAGGDSNY